MSVDVLLPSNGLEVKRTNRKAPYNGCERLMWKLTRAPRVWAKVNGFVQIMENITRAPKARAKRQQCTWKLQTAKTDDLALLVDRYKCVGPLWIGRSQCDW